MDTTVTREQAELVLAAVRAQYAPYLAGIDLNSWDAPHLHEPGHLASGWVIAWEGADGWPLFATAGGTDDMGNVVPPLDGIPADLFLEPVNHCCLGIYPV